MHEAEVPDGAVQVDCFARCPDGCGRVESIDLTAHSYRCSDNARPRAIPKLAYTLRHGTPTMLYALEPFVSPSISDVDPVVE